MALPAEHQSSAGNPRRLDCAGTAFPQTLLANSAAEAVFFLPLDADPRSVLPPILKRWENLALEPAATVLFRSVAIADQSAVAGIAVSRHFDEYDGQLLRVDVEFLVQDLSHALGRPAFLLGGAALQHCDLNMRHGSPIRPSRTCPPWDAACPAARPEPGSGPGPEWPKQFTSPIRIRRRNN